MEKELHHFYASVFEDELYFIREEKGLSLSAESHEDYIKSEDVTNEIIETNDTSDIIFYGDNSSKLCILVDYPSEEWIISRDKMFLEKILGSVQLSIEKTALINVSKTNYKSITSIQKHLPENNFIAFGMNRLFIEDLEYDKICVHGKSKFVVNSANLMDIAMDKGKKMLLWKNMKEMFGL